MVGKGCRQTVGAPFLLSQPSQPLSLLKPRWQHGPREAEQPVSEPHPGPVQLNIDEPRRS